MKTKLLLIVTFITTSVFSQVEDAWVYFKDKPNSAAFFSNPLTALTQRSLDRRTTQGIALDIKDAPIHQPYVDAITGATGITVVAKSKWLNYVHVRGTQTNIAALLGQTFVDRIQYANHSLNAKMSLDNQSSYTDKWLGVQTNYNYGNSATQIQMLNGHILHQQNYTGAGKIIAIMDAGFPGVNTVAPFASLRNRSLILGGYNFVNRSTNYYTGDGHGTMVLSTMGGNATNLVGTAPDASYYLFITENVSTETVLELSNWVEAIEEADRLGVDVVNTSLGYFGFDNTAHSLTHALANGQTSVASRAADIAFTRGMITVTSAGNEGQTPDPYVGTPADALNTITVGSVTSTRVKSGFSSIGPTGDNRQKPDLMAMGSSSVVANSSGTVTTANGTSFSGPILCGAIASFWSAFPNKTNVEIVQLVKQSADRYAASSVTPNNNYGFGIPDFQLALNNALGTNNFEKDAFNVYPNPAHDYLKFEFPFATNHEVVMYNALGQSVKNIKFDSQTFEVNTSDLQSGIYLYTIKSSNSVLNGKFVKQ